MSCGSEGVKRRGPVWLPFSLGAASLFDVGLFTTFSRASSRCTGVAVFGRPWLSEFSGVVLICFRHSRSSVTGFIAHKPEGLLKPVSAQGRSLLSVMGWETGE